MLSADLDTLTNGIEQGFMQRGGWKACRHLLGKLAEEYRSAVNENLHKATELEGQVKTLDNARMAAMHALRQPCRDYDDTRRWRDKALEILEAAEPEGSEA